MNLSEDSPVHLRYVYQSSHSILTYFHRASPKKKKKKKAFLSNFVCFVIGATYYLHRADSVNFFSLVFLRACSGGDSCVWDSKRQALVGDTCMQREVSGRPDTRVGGMKYPPLDNTTVHTRFFQIRGQKRHCARFTAINSLSYMQGDFFSGHLPLKSQALYNFNWRPKIGPST